MQNAPANPDATHSIQNLTLVVNEIYRSLQGESSWVGIPCVLVRLTGCNLRCVWCDSGHAFAEGRRWTVKDLLDRIEELGESLVLITGGEPLLQRNVRPLMQELLDQDKTVILETGGSLDIRIVPAGVVRILDIKCPDSGECKHNHLENLRFLGPRDEVKFVIASRGDYEWARDLIREHGLDGRCTVLMGVVFGVLEPRDLAEWILEDRMAVRFQLQLHKVVWGAGRRGV